MLWIALIPLLLAGFGAALVPLILGMMRQHRAGESGIAPRLNDHTHDRLRREVEGVPTHQLPEFAAGR